MYIISRSNVCVSIRTRTIIFSVSRVYDTAWFEIRKYDIYYIPVLRFCVALWAWMRCSVYKTIMITYFRWVLQPRTTRAWFTLTTATTVIDNKNGLSFLPQTRARSYKCVYKLATIAWRQQKETTLHAHHTRTHCSLRLTCHIHFASLGVLPF